MVSMTRTNPFGALAPLLLKVPCLHEADLPRSSIEELTAEMRRASEVLSSCTLAIDDGEVTLTDAEAQASLQRVASVAGLLRGPSGAELRAAATAFGPAALGAFEEALAGLVAGVDGYREILEDVLDHLAADRALAEPGENIPYDVVRAELGLTG